MSIPSTVTTGELFDAVLRAAKARFGNRFAEYGVFSPEELAANDSDHELVTPALIVVCDRLDYTFDLENADPLGRLTGACSLSLFCVLSSETNQLQQTLVQVVNAFAALLFPSIDGQRFRRGADWGLGHAVEPVADATAQPAYLNLNGRAAWGVRWTQTVYFDDTIPEI